MTSTHQNQGPGRAHGHAQLADSPKPTLNKATPRADTNVQLVAHTAPVARCELSGAGNTICELMAAPSVHMPEQETKMGMFDYIAYEAPCPICGRALTAWQSKSGECHFRRLTPAQLWEQRNDPYYREERTVPEITLYDNCGRCGTWVEIQVKDGSVDWTGADLQAVADTGTLPPKRRGPLPPTRRSSTESLSADEAKLLDDAGLPKSHTNDLLAVDGVRSDTTRLLSAAYTEDEVASALGISLSAVRDRGIARTLWAVNNAGTWLYPAAQFDVTPPRLISGLDAVLPALPADLHPSAVAGFLTTPQPDLSKDGRALTVQDWLRAAGDADPVLRLIDTAEWLGA